MPLSLRNEVLTPEAKTSLLPRRGTANPERQANPCVEAMVRNRWDAYTARKAVGATADMATPIWCFSRGTSTPVSSSAARRS